MSDDRVIFYTEPNYGGESLWCHPGGSNIRKPIRSIKVPDGYVTILYTEPDFGGEIAKVSGYYPHLSDKFDKKVESYLHRPIHGPHATVYEHGDFNGRSIKLEAGRYNSPGIADDTISSVRLQKGVAITLYEDHDFKGKKVRLVQDTDLCRGGDFNDKTSSIVVEYSGTATNLYAIQPAESEWGPVLTLPLKKDEKGVIRAVSASKSPSQMWRIQPVSDGSFYRIISAESGMVLDGAEALLRQCEWNGDKSQIWRIVPVGDGEFKFVSAKSGKVIDLEMPNEVQFCMWNWRGYSRQKFRLIVVGKVQRPIDDFPAEYAIANVNSNKVLDVSSSSKEDGALVEQYEWSVTWPMQKWRVERVDNNGPLYKIVTVNGNKNLSLYNSSNDDGIKLCQWKWENRDWQRWKIINVGGNQFKIESEKSGKVLDVPGGSTGNSTIIEQYGWHGGANQKWHLIPIYELASPAEPKSVPQANKGLYNKCGAEASDLCHDVCPVAASGAAICGEAACGVAHCGADACGTDACAMAACVGAVTAVGVCGQAACALAASWIGACGGDICGAALCAATACGVAACGADLCAVATCGIAASPVGACAVAACPIDVSSDVCGADACGINLCQGDACAADGCAIDVIPFIPGI
ncbi:MAG: hypothetical protein GY795_41255 [Desulfobacterales bacterium]|nr:hypothetical protein [Desulfobacterales bacterium]